MRVHEDEIVPEERIPAAVVLGVARRRDWACMSGWAGGMQMQREAAGGGGDDAIRGGDTVAAEARVCVLERTGHDLHVDSAETTYECI